MRIIFANIILISRQATLFAFFEFLNFKADKKINKLLLNNYIVSINIKHKS
jgi:hypothetical protein